MFQGARYQRGAGIGSILKSVGQFLLPIASTAAASFMGNAGNAMKRGKSFKSASREALLPALGDAVESTGNQIKRKTRRRPAVRRKVGTYKRLGKSKRKQTGGGRKRVYKAKPKTKKSRKAINKFMQYIRSKKKQRTLPTNF